MIIKNSEKWEYNNCPICNADISQEEIDALHCNGCGKDIISIRKMTIILNTPEISTMPSSFISEEEIERLKIQAENIRMGLTKP